MRKLLGLLAALGLASVVSADGTARCSTTPWSGAACSQSSYSTVADLAACGRCADVAVAAEPSVYDDAVSLWKLDEASGTRADSIGSNDLTDNNTVGSTSKGVGAPANLPDTVASFVAANSEYLSCVDDGSAVSIDGDHTFAVWFNSSGTGTNRALISQRTSGDGAYQLYLDTSDLLHAYITDSVAGFSEPVRAGAIADGGWHLAIFTYTVSDKKARIYLDDGAETAGTALSNGPVSLTQSLNVSRLAAVIYGDIRMSALASWTRVLTADERAALWNNGDGAVLP